MNYRHEIDGLRAIAVMGVILYHVGLKSISAGYAGVDVFFVISGFLIGGIIFRQRSNGTFRYRDFYARRIRRILPALFTVILCSIAIGWFIMMPREFRYFGGAAIFTELFLSNVWYFNKINYFNPDALIDPLIHTWSLAVEEQFYLFVPLMFGLLWRFGKNAIFTVFAALATLSFAIAVFTNVEQPFAAFYLIHTRAWELFSGVLAALVFPKLAFSDRAAGWLSNLGLLMILGGLGLTPDHVPWPGVWTAIPVAGTVLVLLFAEAPSLARKTLMLRPLGLIGIISYSAYLWHQPAISFLEISGYGLTNWLQTSAVVVAILGLSWLSWRYIEQPFRTGNSGNRRLKQFGLLSAGLVIAAVAIGGHVTKGYPTRVSQQVRELLAYENSHSATYESCIASLSTVADTKMASRCIHGDSPDPSIAMWGDSHAARIVLPLSTALQGSNLAIRELTIAGCQPIPNLLNYGQKRALACQEYNAKTFDYLITSTTIKTVILNAFWGSYFSSTKPENWLGKPVAGNFYSYPANQDPQMQDQARKEALAAELAVTIKALRESGKSVILLQAAPWPGFKVPSYYGRKAWYGETISENIDFAETLYSKGAMDVRGLLNKAASDAGAVVIDPAEFLCPDNKCWVIRNGEILYADENHLSLPGISLFIPALVKTLLDMDANQPGKNP